jgi:hypothetical protein
MESTKSLPDTFKHHLDIRPGDFRRGHLLIFLIMVPLAVGIYVLLIALARMHRPEIVQLPSWNPSFNIPVLLSIFFVFLLVGIVHESIHGVLILIYTNEIPKLGVHFPGIGVEAPDWHIPRKQMLLIELGPLFSISIIGAILLLIVPSRYVGLVAIGSTINVVGSYMDLAVFLYTYLLPDNSYIRPAEGYASIYIDEPVESNWKSRLLTSLEQRLLPKLL